MSEAKTPNSLRPADVRRAGDGGSAAGVAEGGGPGLKVRGYTVGPGGSLGEAGGQASHDASGPTESGKAVHTRVSVVLPVYNESGLIAKTYAAVAEYARQHPDYEFVFVDDGSSDGTAAMLRGVLERDYMINPNIFLITYSPNRGKGQAVKTGIEATRGDMVLFTDGDLAYSLDHLPALVKELERADVVIGNRNLVHKSERNTTLQRRVMGWTFNRCARLILGMGYSDTQAGLKGFRREAAQRVFALEHLGGFAFDVELVYIAKRLGYTIAEIPAYVSEEHSYKVSKVNLWRDPMRMFGALVDVRVSAWKGRYGARGEKRNGRG